MKLTNVFRGALVAVIAVLAAFTSQPDQALAVGYPAFNIDSWSTNPVNLERGGTFVLTMTFSNVGTYGADEVQVEVADDANFVGLGTSPRYQHMGIGAQVTTTLQVGISETIETGYYGIPIQFSYHHSALGGQTQTATRTIGVNVTGLSPFWDQQDTGAPQLVIEGSQVGLSSAGDGVLLVTLDLRNIGNRTATNVVVNLDSSDVFSPAEGVSSAFGLDKDIDVDQHAEITVPLILIASPEGNISQSFTLEYASYSGGSYSDTQSVPILLGHLTAQTPHLLIEDYTVDPQPITPGAQVRLTLSLANLGAGAAQQVFVRFGDTADSLAPFAPVGSSNVLFLEELPAESRVEMGLDLLVDGSAESGLVPIDVSLTYDSVYGIEETETFTISLRVISSPHLNIDFYEDIPQPVTVGSTFDLPIEVINIGENSVNVSTIEAESDLLQITGGSLYLGQLDGGTSGTFSPSAEAMQAGTATVVVTVNYLDDFQQPQAITQRLSVEVEASPSTQGETGTGEGNGTEFTPPSGGQNGVTGRGQGRGQAMTVGQRAMNGVLGFFGLATRSISAADLGNFQQSAPQQ
jgi:hypothetical protein